MSKSLAARIRKPSVSAYERLCAPRAKNVASADAKDTSGHVRPVGAEVGEDVLRGYLQRENSMGSGTTAAVLRGKTGGFGQPKKVLDKGRWSLATTSLPQSPAMRGFVGLWYRRRFSRFRFFSAVVELQGATVPSGSAVFHRRREMGAFFR